jgi:thiol-disulfide isomerase/thioredoxin
LRNPLLIAAIAVIAAAAGAYTFLSVRDAGVPAPSSAVAVYEATFPDLNGKPRALSEWRGKILVLNFWATWCAPCRQEIPLLVAAQQKWAPRGVQIVGLATWDSPAAIRSDPLARTINYPILLGSDDALSLLSKSGIGDGVIPVTGIFDRQGKLVSTRKGAYRPGELDAILKKLLEKGG